MREEIQHSEVLREQYRLGRWARFLDEFVWQLRRTGPIGVFLGALMMSVPSTTVSVGIGRILPPSAKQDPRLAQGNGSELAMLLQALFLTGWMLLLAMSSGRQFWRSKALAVHSSLPVPDGDYLRSALDKEGASVAFFFGLFSFLGYAYYAWSLQAGVLAWTAALALAALQGWLSLSTFTFLQGRFSNITLGVAGTALWLIALFAGILGPAFRPYVEGYTWIVSATLPAGWVNLAFFHGLVQHHSTGWLWLLPALPVIILAYRRVGKPFAIQEFVLHPGREAEAIPEKWCAGFKPPPFRFFGRPRTSKRSATASSAADIEEKILAGRCLHGLEWHRLGWLERLVSRCLNGRERGILECMLDGPPQWTWWWKVSVYCIGGSFAILFLPLGRGDKFATWAFGAMAQTLLFCTGPAVLWMTRGRPRGSCPSLWLPIGHTEISQVLWKVHLVSNLAIQPPLFVVWTALAWKINGRPMAGVIMECACLYSVLVLFPCFLIAAVDPGRRSDSVELRRLPMLFAIGCIITIVLFALAYLALLWPRTMILAIAIILPFCTFGTWFMHLRILNRPNTDWHS